MIESSSLKPVLRGQKNKYNSEPMGKAEASTKAHKSPSMDKGMLQYLMLYTTEPVAFITKSAIMMWGFTV